MAEEENDTLYYHTKMSTCIPALADILPALKRLDALLARGVEQAQVVYGSKAANDAYRGLYTSREQAEGLLKREPGAPILWKDDGELEASSYHTGSNGMRLAWIKKVFALSDFDVDSIMIALAPELDLRYERLYAYLQDDVSRKRPTVELVLNLLCPSAEVKLAHRIHFLPDAPLIRHDLLHLITDPNQVPQPLLAQYLKLDNQIIRLVLGQESLDSRLARFCKVIEPAVSLEILPLDAEKIQALPVLVSEAREKGQPLRLYFHGPSGGGKRQTAEALAREAGTRLLVVDLVHALSVITDFEQVLKLVFREAWFQDAILFLEGMDALRRDEQVIQYRYLLDDLSQDAGITILSGKNSWIPSARDPLGVLTVSFSIPEFVQRRDCWEANLVAADISIDDNNLEKLANRFRLTPGQIAEAVTTARSHDRWLSATQDEEASAKGIDRHTFMSLLLAAARAQSGHDLAQLAHKVEPLYTWDNIVLPEDTLKQLREICQRVALRHRVLGEWGFDRKLSLGKGINALFAGPSGTGKTMAAEIIANELGFDLYKIDLSGVVSKYIGQTEKNLDRVFRAAENANAILFFDEADALFGKRSEVRDSHDRYANIEISFLLQKMEQYDGIAILATNLSSNLDEAFTRRLAFTVHFPFPDEVSRRRIWSGIWPVETPLADDVDLDFTALQFKLSGGNIKNIALAAAFIAAEEAAAVTMSHLLQATRREYQKMGKQLTEAELTSAPEEFQPVTRIAK